MKPWIVYIIILLAAGIYAGGTAPGKADANRVYRIAILALDASEEVQSIVPLLTASLSASNKVQLVERADLERIISEQHLSLSGLTDPATQLRVGQLIRADGMVLLSKDIDRNRIVLHMVETRQGFRICLMSYPLSKRAIVAVAGDIQDDLLKSIDKLSLDPSQCLLISIARVGNSTLIPDSSWIETELPGFMEQCFSRYSRVLILERRQLDKLLDEAKITGHAANSFRADGIIVDGELALTTGVPLDKKAPAVTFTVRFRNAAGRDLGRVAVQGTLNDREALIARIVAASMVKIRELGVQTGGRPEDESKLWLELARKQGSLWAAESAYALNPTNAETQATLIELLVSRGAAEHNPHPNSRCCHPGETEEQHADALVRAYELYCSAPSPGLRKIFAAICKPNYALHHGFLYQDYSRDNPEISERLKPVRQLIRLALEEGGNLYMMGYGSAIFCDSPLDQIAYARNFTQRTIEQTPAASRGSCLADFFIGMWRFNQYPNCGTAPGIPVRGVPISCSDRPSVQNAWNRFYQELRSSPEPAAVFLACYYLACGEQSDAERQRLVQEAVTAGDRVVAQCGFEPSKALVNKYFAAGDGVVAQCVGVLAELYAQLCFDFSRDPQLLVKACLLSPSVEQRFYALTNIFQRIPVPPESQQQMLSSVQALYNHQIARRKRYPIPNIEEITGKLTRQYGTTPPVSVEPSTAGSVQAGPAAMAAATNERVLFSTAFPEWRKRVRFLKQPESPGPENGCIVPQRLLLEGSNLWIGAGSYERGYARWRGVGLVHLELPSGRMVSLRAGDLPDWAKLRTTGGAVGSNFIRPDITAMRRWNDVICMGQINVGVYLFPITVTDQDRGLNGVRLLTSQDGLVDLNIRAVTCMGSDLLIAASDFSDARGNIVCWNRETHKTRLILNTADQLSAASLGNPGQLIGLTSDRQGRFLYAFFRPSKSMKIAIWKLSLAEGQWTELDITRILHDDRAIFSFTQAGIARWRKTCITPWLTPFVPVKRAHHGPLGEFCTPCVQNSGITYKLVNIAALHEFQAGKIVFDCHYESLDKTHSSNRTFAYGGQFEADSEVLTDYDSKAFISLLPAIPSVRIHEAVEYDGGIIAIIGNGADQRVSYFPGITFQSAILPPNP